MDLKTLRLVLEMEQKKENELAREFGQAQGILSQQEQRYEGLSQYRTDYLRQANEQAQTGVGANTFGHYHAFISKLDTGITEQHKQVLRMRGHVQVLKARWLEQQRKRKSIEYLMEKQQEELRLKANLQEQKMLDEFATQAYVRRKK